MKENEPCWRERGPVLWNGHRSERRRQFSQRNPPLRRRIQAPLVQSEDAWPDNGLRRNENETSQRKRLTEVVAAVRATVFRPLGGRRFAAAIEASHRRKRLVKNSLVQKKEFTFLWASRNLDMV